MVPSPLKKTITLPECSEETGGGKFWIPGGYYKHTITFANLMTGKVYQYWDNFSGTVMLTNVPVGSYSISYYYY